MANSKHSISIDLYYKIDKKELENVTRDLQNIRFNVGGDEQFSKLSAGMKEAYAASSKLEDILSSSWDAKLNQLDLSKVQKEIKNTFYSVENLQTILNKAPETGQKAFDSFAQTVLRTNTQIKQSSKLLDDMAVTFGNTIRFGISSSIFNNFANSIQKAYDYAVDLDTSLGNIRIVTEKSADEMERFAVLANESAKELGTSTLDYTNAALIYAQQGLSDEEIAARTEITLKTANVTDQSTSAVSEQLTAVWNGYKVSADEAELYVDKLAAVAATTAADLEELSTGMSKVASAANIMGVDVDQLNATLATVISVTRQAPETVGTAFKTIYARMGDIEAGIDTETTLGSYTEQMKEIAGINVLDVNGQLRDMGEVIEEVGNMWTTLTREQQIALSQAMAGTRQYNNLLSLFDNWEMYETALEESAQAAGSLNKQQSIYLETTEAHLQKLSTTAEEIYDTLFDTDTVNNLIETLTSGLSLISSYLKSFGGGMQSILGIATTLGVVFNRQIGASLERMVENVETAKKNKSTKEIQQDIIQSYKAEGKNVSSNSAKLEAEVAEKRLKVQSTLTEAQNKEFIDRQKAIGQLQDEIDKLYEYKDIAEEMKNAGLMNFLSTDAVTQGDFSAGIEGSEQILNNLQLIKDTIETLEQDRQSFSDSQAEANKNKQFISSKQKEKQDLGSQYQIQEGFTLAKNGQLQMDIIEVEEISQKIVNINKEIAAVQAKQVKIAQDVVEKKEISEKKEEELRKLIRENYATSQAGAKILAKQVIKEEDIKDLTVEIAKDIKKQEQYQEKMIKGSEKLQKVDDGIVEEKQETIRLNQQIIDQQAIQAERQQLIQSAVTAVSGYATLINAVQSLSQAFGDGEITAEDWKMAITSLITNIPILITTYKNLYQAFASFQTLIDAQNASLALNNTLKISGSQESVKKAKSLIAETLQMDANTASTGANTVTQEGYAVVTGVNTTLTGVFTGALAAAKEAMDKFTASMMKNPLFAIAVAVTAAIMVLVGAISAITAAEEKAREARIEDNKAIIESENARQQELKTNLELYNSYLKLYSAYQDDVSAKEDMIKAAEELGGLIDQELLRVAKLTGNYEDLTEAIKEAKQEALEETVESATTEQVAAKANVKETAFETLDFSDYYEDEEGHKYSVIRFDSGFWQKDEKEAMELLSDNLEDLLSDPSEAWTTRSYTASYTLKDDDIQTMVEAYGRVQKAVQEMQEAGVTTESEVYVSAKEWLAEHEEIINAYIAATEQLDTANIELALSDPENENYIDFSNIVDDEDFKNKLDDLEDYLGSLSTYAGKTQSELHNIALEYVKDISTATEEYVNRLALINNTTSQLKLEPEMGVGEAIWKKFTGDGDVDVFATIEDNFKRHFLNIANSSEYEEALSSLTTDELTALNNLTEDQLNLYISSFTKAGMSIPEALQAIAQSFNTTEETQITLSESMKEELETLDVSEDAFARYTKHIMKNSEALKDNEEAAKRVAMRAIKLNHGVGLLVEGFEDWEKVLKAGRTDSIEYYETLSEMGEALEYVFGMEVSEDFMIKHLKEIGELAEGDTDKLKELQQLATQDYVANMQIIAPADEIDGLRNELSNFVNEFDGKEVEIGTTLSELKMDDYVKSLNDMLAKGQITVEQANKILEGIGFSPEVTYEEVPTTVKHTYTASVLGKKIVSFDLEDKSTVQVPQINADATSYSGPPDAIDLSNTGGTGKSGSSNEPNIEDLIADELDRYHDVNIELAKVANNLELIQERTDELVGQSKIDNLTKQFELLNKQITTTEEKIKIAEGELSELQQELASKGVTFSADGTITNYATAYKTQLNYVNSIIEKYNSMSKKQQESYQSTYDAAVESFEKFVDNIDRYDEVLTDLIPGLQMDIEEAVDEQIELKLQALHYGIDLKLDIKDAQLEWNEFKKTVLDDIDDTDILGNTKAKLEDWKVYFEGVDESLIQASTDHINTILNDLKAMDAGGEGDFYKDDRTQAMEDLKEYYSTLMDNLTEVHELSEEIHDSYMEMMDEAQEKFDEQISTFETINNLLEHDKNVISMIYGEESYSALSQFYDRQEENNNKQLDFQRQQVEFWANQMALTEEGSEEWDNAKEKWIAAVESWNAAVENSIQNLQDKYLNAINEIFQKLNNEVTNGLGLDYVETQWDLINKNADEYLDSVNAIYGVQQLQSKYLDAIEQTDSAAQQKRLNDLMEQEIGYLREQDKLSQYDLDRANLKYEIALKQIALEEAQQNKTQLRLRRDSQGNYTYQYTADDDQVSSIQQELSDLYNQLYNLDADEYQSNLESLYDVWVEFQEKMAEAAQINDPEQRAAKELLIKEQYGELINTLAEKNELTQSNLYQSTMSHLFDLYDQNIENYDMMTAEQQMILDNFMTAETDFANAAFDNLFGLYNANIESFASMSESQKDILMNSILPQWESGVQAMADKFVGEGGFIPVCSDAFTELDSATQEYEDGLVTLQENAGQSFDEIKQGVDEVVTSTELLLENNDDLIQDYKDQLQAIAGVIEQLDALEQEYKAIADAAKQAATEANNFWIAASKEDANVDLTDIKEEEFGSSTDDNSNTNTSNSSSNSTSSNTNALGYASNGAPIIANYTVKGNDTLSGIGAKYGVAWRRIYAENKSVIGSDPNKIYPGQKLQIPKYASGGYTGDWAGNSGQLAMLHKKELVLNANDTENMLNAIEIMREITSNLGATLMSKMAGVTAVAAQGGNDGVLEQNVHITAEFPNVENSHEIEDALNNLINKASQYIQK